MSIGEMLLRLGCALVAWLMLYTHCIWLATLLRVGCGPDGDQLWRLLLGFAPVAVGFSLLLGLTRRLPPLHQTQRWLAAPLVVLLPLALAAVWPTFADSTLGGRAICDDQPAAAWQRWWAPVQFLALAVLALMSWRAVLPSNGRVV